MPFADHALTTELMEGELLAAVAATRDNLPLRDAYLPTTDAAFSIEARACVGGTVSLLAIARQRAGVRDYVLFTQERSSTVLNLAGKLAMIPKGFHQPTGEPADEVRLSATLQREFEEELLGRGELEQIEPVIRHRVDLLHAQHRTEPMAWLLDRPGSFRAECTGFGFNLVTGNYEFACLMVIEDEGWWDRFGHMVESNWEAERVNRTPRSTQPACKPWLPIHGGATRACSPSFRGSSASPTSASQDRVAYRPSNWTPDVELAHRERRSGRESLSGLALGHFVEDPGDLRHSEAVEVKWGVHAAGDERTEWSPGVHDRTVLILIEGRWRLELAEGELRRILSRRPRCTGRLRRVGQANRPPMAGGGGFRGDHGSLAVAAIATQTRRSRGCGIFDLGIARASTEDQGARRAGRAPNGTERAPGAG